ncbi:MAG: 16S rRNA (guanine(966)-N(2))-methyltransferase RsmD [Deltaproteobacteria bacterium]|nr:16S rRNA (guanine(966)-N(2))-methyltransferase RsmD [Deltaproteobacteria bacterium]
MRVVGGKSKGRRLASFRCGRIRPTSDMVREAVFNVLGQDMTSKGILDLFAGTGAMGIEALSRGAGRAVFVDNDAAAISVIKKNISLCGFDGNSTVLKNDAKGALRHLEKTGERFDVIFMDAPYPDPSLTGTAIDAIITAGLLNPDGAIVCEVSKRHPIEPLPAGVTVEKEKRYGDTLVYFLKAS